VASKVVGLKERRQEKIAKVKYSRRKRIIIFTTTLSALILGGWLLYTSSFFNVKEIEVRGNKNLTDQYVIENSGIERDDTLFNLPFVKIKVRLQKLNWVYKAKVLRDWPDSVVLDIKERKPVAFIENDKGKFLVDEKGFVIDKLANLKAGARLPKIGELPLKEIKVGDSIKSGTAKNALKAYAGLDEELRQKVHSITARSVEELYFIVQGVDIVYGKAEQVSLKNKVIKTILKEKKENISTLDIRVPDKPVVRVLGK